MENFANWPLNEGLYDMLERIRRKPGLYIGMLSIKVLYGFLNGYDYGGGRQRDAEDFHRFHDWVAKRLGFYESTSGWCNMILDRSESDEDAFHRFFVLLDEFRKETTPARNP